MRASRFAAAVLALALVASGCGGSGGQRRQVAGYLRQVNAAEKTLATPLAAVTKANRSLGRKHPDLAAVHADLLRAQARTRAARAKLAALHPPTAARRLRTLLLELADRQIELTGETAKLVAFLPRFDAARLPLRSASALLQAELAQKRAKPAAKAAALDAYAAAVGGAVESLRRLDPPPVSAPAYRDQLAALVRVQAAARALAAGLRSKHADLAQLLHDFDAASVATGTTAAQRAQIAAVRDYNRRIRSIDGLLRRIALEEARLGRVT